MYGEDSEYFSWLSGLICSYNFETEKWRLLLYFLYEFEFKALVEGDFNRLSDIDDLRDEYCAEIGYTYSDIPDNEGTVLELLIVLSRRIIYIMGDNERGLSAWFWLLVSNLVGDPGYFSGKKLLRPSIRDDLDNILEIFVNRTYNFDGSGGIFPLNNPENDQKKVEIWYQMQAFLNEKFPD